MLPALPRRARDWCAGRSPGWRSLLLAYLAYAGARHVVDGDYQDLFAGPNFVAHELGHLVFSGLGPFLAAFGGTFWELAVPAIALLVLVRLGDWFGAAAAGCWISFAILDVARYVADARRMALPLVGPAEAPRHDWNFLLGQLGLLPHDAAIALLLRAAALLLWGASVLFALRLLVEMPRGAPARV